MDTAAVVFLFDADAPDIPSWYGGVFDPAFLGALSSADPGGRTSSSVLRGDAILSQLATKITAVSKGEHQSGYQQSYDKELLSTVIWDIADALVGQWNTVDAAIFPLFLGRHNIHCISIPSLPAELKAQVDRLLRSTNGYLGAIEVDLGNPIQRFVFIDCLVKDAVISGGQVILELGCEGTMDTLFEGANTFQPKGLQLVPYGALVGLQPPVPTPSTLSPRGRLSLERYEGKRKFSLQERVVAALSHENRIKSSLSSYEFAVKDDSYNPLDADLPEAKFVQYLLDPNHPKGGSKAMFFREALGIAQQDWRYLAAQLHDGLKRAKLTELGVKSWQDGLGITFNAVMPVKGLNGRTIDIDSNWIMEPGMQPRLSTAVPAKPSDTTGNEGITPAIVGPHLDGRDRWQTIFDLASEAGRIAAETTIPTPVFIDGFGIEPEGNCGHAWIRLMDARVGFAKWIIASGHGRRHHKSGAQLSAAVSSQSVDRCMAYALAFARVLMQNGIACEVESQLT